MKDLPPVTVPLTVNPRKPAIDALPIIALTSESLLIERTGETYTADNLPTALVAEPSSIIVCQGIAGHICALNAAFHRDETFQYKLTPVFHEQHPINGETKRKLVLRNTTVSLIGWKGHYHYPLDPVTFIRQSIDEIDPSDRPTIIKLLEWAKEVRAFCIDNQLRVKPSSGGLAAQLLRDPRFYPNPRRKVPKLVNAHVRAELPGNFYELYAQPKTFHSALYLDMNNAHHNLAREIRFPCANSLRAHGYFHSQDGRDWARGYSKRYHYALSCPGMYLVHLSVPRIPASRFPPPYMRTPGRRLVWIYSNELDLIYSLGGSIDSICAAIISDESETGINKYAEYALRELERRPEQRGWLKPTLHSVYGMLAGRPRQIEFGYRHANGGTPDTYPVGAGLVPVHAVRTSTEIEPKIVNVIHRAMIEVETRTRALNLARDLTERGGRVLCIYADSLFVKIDRLPILPHPWRAKEYVHGLQFLSATHFTSASLVRLPGVPKDSGARRIFRPTRRVESHG